MDLAWLFDIKYITYRRYNCDRETANGEYINTVWPKVPGHSFLITAMGASVQSQIQMSVIPLASPLGGSYYKCGILLGLSLVDQITDVDPVSQSYFTDLVSQVILPLGTLVV